jgi:chromatin remodeling complex protein RSC6
MRIPARNLKAFKSFLVDRGLELRGGFVALQHADRVAPLYEKYLAKAKAKAKTTKQAAPKPRRRAAPPRGDPAVDFNRPFTPSPELAAVIGPTPRPRTSAVQRLWSYIKRHDLQDRQNLRMINPDELLGRVTGHEPLSMFALTAKLNQHLH